MPIKLGDVFPDFPITTTDGDFASFHEWIGRNWTILFSHPADFTPVCTTELARAAQLEPDFSKRGVKIIALSCDSVETHREWIKDIVAFANISSFPFPIIADSNRQIANLLEMLDPDEVDSTGIPLTARAVFIIDEEKRMRLSILYPATTGRSFDEILRVLDSLLPNDDCFVLPTMTDQKANEQFGKVNQVPVPSGKPYLRFVRPSS